jgi:predicted DNA-binding protein
MNWITTNLRLPEDLYMELKMKAAKERKSVASVIREKLSENKKIDNNADELLNRMKQLSEKLTKDNPGLNLTKSLIEMRYEQ